jgi:hypothetical protein
MGRSRPWAREILEGHPFVAAGAIGLAAIWIRRWAGMAKKVFVSFDYDNDKTLRDFIIGQSKLADSPFTVTDYSLKEAAPQKDWEKRARAAISRADVFIVMLGPKTGYASGVIKEVAMANDLGKTKFQIVGYKNGSEDWAVPGGGRAYRWNWENLKKLLA